MTSFRIVILTAVITALVTLAVYLPAAGNGFVNWDDDLYVYENPEIRSLDVSFLRWAFTSFSASNWHPLTWISHALDYAIWGLDPRGHHLTNILLHAMNTLLVVILAAGLLEAREEQYGRNAAPAFLKGKGAVIAAGTTGLLFGIHPLHVESVAWVSERKDLLCGLFFLTSLVFSLRHARAAGACPGGASRTVGKHYGLSLLFFVLALLSKPMAVSLPLVLVILDWHPFRRIRDARTLGASLLEKAPFFVLSAASSVLTVMAQRTGEAMTMLPPVPLWGRMLVAARAAAAYLSKMIAPVGLEPYYAYPTRSEVMQALPSYLFSVAVVLVITIACMVLARRERAWLSAWGYYVLTLIPVIGIVQVGLQSMADRYTYLPSLGPFLVAGISASWTWSRASREGTGKTQFVTAFAALALCAILLLTSLTMRQIRIWRSGIDLWSHVLERRPEDPLAYHNRGMAYAEEGLFDRALADLDTAFTLDPSPYLLSLLKPNRLWVEEQRAQLERAEAAFRKAVSRNPRDARAYTERGIAFGSAKLHARALQDFTTAIALDPAYADAYTGSGVVYAEQGQIDRAIEEYTKALAVDPSNADAYLNRGVAFERRNEPDRALADYDRVTELDPSDHQAYINRGMVFRKTERVERAIESFTRAIALNPGLAVAHVERGDCYLRTGRPGPAMRDFQKACDLGSEEGCEMARRIRRDGRHS